MKEAAIAGLGIIALPGYLCRAEVQAGSLRRVLPSWFTDETTIKAAAGEAMTLASTVTVDAAEREYDEAWSDATNTDWTYMAAALKQS